MFEKILESFCIDKKNNFAIYSIIWIFVCTIFLILITPWEIDILPIFFFVLVFIPILFIITISPSILLLYFLFKKIQNNSFKTFICTAIIFLNCLLNIIVLGDIWSFSVGYFMLYVIFPLLFITICITPKKYLSKKRYLIIVIILLEVLGCITKHIVYYEIPYRQTNELLKPYDKTIESLEDYRKQKGYYPRFLKEIDVITTDKLKYSEYKRLENGKNYEYTLKEENKTYLPAYVYTPNQEYKEKLLKNEQRKYEPVFYKKQGKWIIKKIVD